MGVTAPAGFRAAGVACGIKKAGALDLALIVADPVTVTLQFVASVWLLASMITELVSPMPAAADRAAVKQL